MLDQINLATRLKKSEYKSIMEELEPRLALLQRRAIELRIPVVVVFEGWNAAGKGTLINQLIQALDPRHFTVAPIHPPNDEERLRPFLWRFWIRTPARGRMTIFDRSWYTRVLQDRVLKTVSKAEWTKAYDEINYFERQLAEDGNVIIKFLLHIDRAEQERRLKKLEGNASTAWRVTKADWRNFKLYDRFLGAMKEMLARTDTRVAPWRIVESHDRRFATVKIFQTVINALETRIAEIEQNGATAANVSVDLTRVDSITTSILDQVDLSKTLSKDAYSKKLKRLQGEMRNLEHEVYVKRIPVIVVYEGWDAAGKGGNIRRLTQTMDPRGYSVIPIAAPNDIEKRHHYLWRFWKEMPKAGHVAIFDRSWYGRVMVERVEGFATEVEWKRAYREIREMEAHLANSGAVIVKFWLHIDRDEQLQRFEARKVNPFKSWKLTEEDWRNREKWDRYKAAVDEMLLRTSTPYAPWTVVESNSKYYARIKAIETVVAAIRRRLAET